MLTPHMAPRYDVAPCQKAELCKALDAASGFTEHHMVFAFPSTGFDGMLDCPKAREGDHASNLIPLSHHRNPSRASGFLGTQVFPPVRDRLRLR